jgi:hypothetical protein
MQVELCEIPLVEDPARGTGAPETGDPPAGRGVQAQHGQISWSHRQRTVSARGVHNWYVAATRDEGNAA